MLFRSDLVAETRLGVDDVIAPLFVREGIDRPEPIVSLPGVVQHTRESLRQEVRELIDLGVKAVILFGVPSKKDPLGSAAWDPNGIVQVALQELRSDFGDSAVLMADCCLDEYTSHGHCGVVRDDGEVDNDQTIELYARAIENDAMAQRLGGTRVAGFQVILSVLFDDQGVSRGFRMITDPRAAVQERRVGFMFRQRIQLRYGIEGWTCTDLPPAQGETPVGGVFIKVDCEKRTPERNLFVQARFLRKAGQFDYDPVTREPGVGQFESQTRFEIFDPGFGPAGG